MRPPQFLNARHTNSTWKQWYVNKKYASKIIFINKHKKKQDPKLAFPGLNSKRGFAYNFLWILLISFSALTCCYQTYERLSFFLSRPVETRVTLIRNSAVKFPSITLCPVPNNYIPLNGLRYEKQLKTGTFLCLTHVFNLLNDALNITAIWDLMGLNGSFAAWEFSRSKLLSGNFGRDSPLFSVKTDTKTVFGTCYTYSYENLLEFIKDDFMLMFGFYENLTLCDAIHTNTFMLHNDDDIVTYKSFAEAKWHHHLTKAVYGLSAKRFKILNREGKPCDTNRVVNECEKNCFENVLKNMSACRLPLTSVPEMPLCAGENDSLVAYYQLMNLAVNFNYLKRCNCPKVCDEILYTDHFKMIQQYKAAVLAFYFDDNVIEEIEEYYSYRFISFVCDVGGNLGLFLGLSIPAMFKIGESVVVYFLKKFNRAQ